MKEQQYTTNIKNNKTKPDASAGIQEKEIGYTSSKSPTKDDVGRYELTGAQTIDPEDEKCYSKEIVFKISERQNKHKYYIKANSEGFLFNPWGMFSEGTEAKYEKGHGRLKWRFTEVNKRCFDFYNRFLESRNQAWLANAEREIR
jgi:hypothetical protein